IMFFCATGHSQVANRTKSDTTQATRGLGSAAVDFLKTPITSVLGRAACGREVVRRVDHCHVGERLRKVANEPLAYRVVLFAEEPDVVRQTGEAIEERLSFRNTALQNEVVGEPERAR